MFDLFRSYVYSLCVSHWRSTVSWLPTWVTHTFPHQPMLVQLADPRSYLRPATGAQIINPPQPVTSRALVDMELELLQVAFQETRLDISVDNSISTSNRTSSLRSTSNNSRVVNTRDISRTTTTSNSTSPVDSRSPLSATITIPTWETEPSLTRELNVNAF